MLASLGMVLVKSSHAADAYERAIGWKAAVEGAANQAAGTRQPPLGKRHLMGPGPL